MEDVIILNHPLIQHKLTLIRDKKTEAKDFEGVKIIYSYDYEVTRYSLKDIIIETPLRDYLR